MYLMLWSMSGAIGTFAIKIFTKQLFFKFSTSLICFYLCFVMYYIYVKIFNLFKFQTIKTTLKNSFVLQQVF